MKREEFVEAVKNAVRGIFAKNGEIITHAMLLDEDGDLNYGVIPAPVTEFEKQMHSRIIGNAISELRMEHSLVALVSEAWFGSRVKGVEDITCRPSEDPNRREVVIVMFYGQEQSDIAAEVCPIIRDGDSASLGEWEDNSDIVGVRGTLCQDPKPPANWN